MVFPLRMGSFVTTRVLFYLVFAVTLRCFLPVARYLCRVQLCHVGGQFFFILFCIAGCVFACVIRFICDGSLQKRVVLPSAHPPFAKGRGRGTGTFLGSAYTAFGDFIFAAVGNTFYFVDRVFDSRTVDAALRLFCAAERRNYIGQQTTKPKAETEASFHFLSQFEQRGTWN